MLDLFRQESQTTPAPSDEHRLRAQIGRVIDAALVNTQEVDSRRVTILLSDLRGFTAMAEPLPTSAHQARSSAPGACVCKARASSR